MGARAAHEPVEFRAPDDDSGLYLLELFAGRHETSVPVAVQSSERARMLVVLPVATWSGTELVDEQHDGVLDTLPERAPRCSWPRVLPGMLPDDFYATAAPLLRFLDRAGIRYDLTTDIDLALSRSPRASDRDGVLLAGSERWITRSYARRLRRYVSEGGRLASFGIESMRRGVTLLHDDERTAGRLVRPTQPAVQDPFGTRFEDVRRTREPVTLTLIGGDAANPLLLGFDGALSGFSVLEESELPTGERGGELLAALGVETLTEEETQEVPDELPPEPLPALASTRLGEGLLIRVGLPQWGQRLDDRQVAQLTLNIADLLRRFEPRIRTVPAARLADVGALGAEPAALDPQRLHPLPQRQVLRVRRPVAAREAERGALGGELVERALALGRRPAQRPVPQLGIRVRARQPARQRVLERVEDDQRARDAGQPQPVRLHDGEAVGERVAEPRGGARRRAAAGRRRRRRARSAGPRRARAARTPPGAPEAAARTAAGPGRAARRRRRSGPSPARRRAAAAGARAAPAEASGGVGHASIRTRARSAAKRTVS